MQFLITDGETFLHEEQRGLALRSDFASPEELGATGVIK
jgi:hypothetical protein